MPSSADSVRLVHKLLKMSTEFCPTFNKINENHHVKYSHYKFRRKLSGALNGFEPFCEVARKQKGKINASFFASCGGECIKEQKLNMKIEFTKIEK
jgi:hypothetical protein